MMVIKMPFPSKRSNQLSSQSSHQSSPIGVPFYDGLWAFILQVLIVGFVGYTLFVSAWGQAFLGVIVLLLTRMSHYYLTRQQQAIDGLQQQLKVLQDAAPHHHAFNPSPEYQATPSSLIVQEKTIAADAASAYDSEPHVSAQHPIHSIHGAHDSLLTSPIVTPANRPKAWMPSLLSDISAWFRGGNSIVRVAVVILLMGVILLLRFASEKWQLSLATKLAAIAIGGGGLTAIGIWLRQKRLDYAVSLQGAGLGILYLVLFSAFYLQVVSNLTVTYGVLGLLLIMTLMLALWQSAIYLAFIALGCGFIAPFVLHQQPQNIAGLMAFYFALNLAIAMIAWFKPWRILNVGALLMTFGMGGYAIWFNAEPTQYHMIAVWIWAIFAIYLFISIRYSQLMQRQFQQSDPLQPGTLTPTQSLPRLDMTLLFASPFMAFSLYGGVVASDGHHLSIASAVLALIYGLLGYRLSGAIVKHNVSVNTLAQCFYGLGAVFFALILPFAFNAYWTGVGWTLNGLAMVYLGRRFGLQAAKVWGVILLLSGGVATLYHYFTHDSGVRFTAAVLMLSYAASSMLLWGVPKFHITKRVCDYCATLLLIVSFLISPYVFDAIYVRTAPAMLLWLLLINAALLMIQKIKTKAPGLVSDLSSDLAPILVIIHRLNYSVLTVGFLLAIELWYRTFFATITVTMADRQAIFLTAVLWLANYGVLMRWHRLDNVADIQSLTMSPSLRLFSPLMWMMSGALLTVWCPLYVVLSLWVVVPLLLIALSYYWRDSQALWRGHWGFVLLASVWLWWVNLSQNGDWALAYVPLFNAVDGLSIVVGLVILLALKPLFHQHTTRPLIGVLVLANGLLIISSIVLRLLTHWLHMPYSLTAIIQNGTIQAALTILWASTALILTLWASRKSWRTLWIIGIAILMLVIGKLVLLDLSHTQTLTRIISFIGSGLIMLIIGYFAPLPPHATRSENEQ